MLAILALVSALVYVVTVPETGDTFTEFYILGLEGKAENYPSQMALGEEGIVILGVVNREHEEVSYEVEMRVDGVTSERIGPRRLAHEERWEQQVRFVPTKVGEEQKVEFLLYELGQDKPCETLHLWIDVKEQ